MLVKAHFVRRYCWNWALCDAAPGILRCGARFRCPGEGLHWDGAKDDAIAHSNARCSWHIQSKRYRNVQSNSGAPCRSSGRFTVIAPSDEVCDRLASVRTFCAQYASASRPSRPHRSLSDPNDGCRALCVNPPAEQECNSYVSWKIWASGVVLSLSILPTPTHGQ